MKILKTIALAFVILITYSCKKDNPVAPTPNPSTAKNTPNFVAINYKWDTSIGWWSFDGFIFYDLNHDDNKDKKYFTAKIAKFDSLKIVKGPLPIDSAATNWPAGVKSCGYGYNTDMYVNAHMRMKVANIAADGRFIYVYDSIYHRPPGGPKYGGGIHSTFNDPAIAGSRAGKTPQGLSMVRASGLPGGAIAWMFLSYFKEGSCTGWLTGGGSGELTSESFSSMFPGTPNYDWVNVNNVIFYQNEFGWDTHVFFDFKNWRYFTWKEECVNYPDCSSIKVTMGSYKSLDTFMAWPEGWGKP